MKIILQDDEGRVLREEILSDADVSAMETDILDVPEWIINAVTEKARRRIDHIVEKSGRGSRYTGTETKREIIGALKKEGHELLKSAAVKEAEALASRAAQKENRKAALKAAREN